MYQRKFVSYASRQQWIGSIAVLVFAAASLLDLSCSRDNATEELVIISPHAPEIRAEFSRGFSQWQKTMTGKFVSISWLDVGGTGQAIEYLRSRSFGSRQAGGVDLFFGGGDYPFIKLQSLGLLASYRVPDPILSNLPRTVSGVSMYDSGYYWYGAAISGFGILYNTVIARQQGLQLPRRWEDLAQPQYQGWVSCGDPRYSGSIHMMFEILLQAYGWRRGWEVLTKIGANVQSFTRDASSAAQDVSSGQAAFGMAIDFYAFAEIDRYGADRLGFVLPEGETVVTPDGIGIVRNAPNPSLAQRFVEYALSEGQKLWFLKKGERGGPQESALCRYPSDSTLYDSYSPQQTAVSLAQNPYKLTSTVIYNSALGGKRWQIVGDLIACFVIIPHAELSACWRELKRRNLRPEEHRSYFSIEIGEQEADRLSQEWSKPQFALRRIQIMNAWVAQARKRYAAALRHINRDAPGTGCRHAGLLNNQRGYAP